MKRTEKRFNRKIKLEQVFIISIVIVQIVLNYFFKVDFRIALIIFGVMFLIDFLMSKHICRIIITMSTLLDTEKNTSDQDKI